MKVVFIKPLKGTAKLHDVKEVSDGYAQNFLIPKGYAVVATQAIMNNIETEKKYVLENEHKHAQELQQLLSAISATQKITITDHPHAKGRLYNAVTAQEISHAFHVQHNIFVPKQLLSHYEPIREVGDHHVIIGDKKQSVTYLISVI